MTQVIFASVMIICYIGVLTLFFKEFKSNKSDEEKGTIICDNKAAGGTTMAMTIVMTEELLTRNLAQLAGGGLQITDAMVKSVSSDKVEFVEKNLKKFLLSGERLNNLSGESLFGLGVESNVVNSNSYYFDKLTYEPIYYKDYCFHANGISIRSRSLKKQLEILDCDYEFFSWVDEGCKDEILRVLYIIKALEDEYLQGSCGVITEDMTERDIILDLQGTKVTLE